MSLHTEDDGHTPNPLINRTSWDIHWPELGPPLKLIGAYVKGKISWQVYESEYVKYLRTSPEAADKIAMVLAIAYERNVSLLCIEENPRYCHRRLLMEHIHLLAPELPIGHIR